MGKVVELRNMKRALKMEKDIALMHRMREEDAARAPIPAPSAKGLRSKWIPAFLLDKRTGNRTEQTLETYEKHLGRFARDCGDLTPLGVRKYLGGLHSTMKPISVHKHYRTLRSFLGWGVRNGMLSSSPLAGFDMKMPVVEKSAPTDADVSALLRACDLSKWEGRRNRALVSILVDAGLRISEAAQLRWSDLFWAEHKVRVHGKGDRFEFTPFGPTAGAALKMWHATQRPESEDGYVFTDRSGKPLRRDWGTHIVHRLSRKAGVARRDEKTGKWSGLVGPHALRRYAATSLLNETGDLELVRRTLRHSTLTMSLKYAKVAGVDVTRKFLAHSPLDRLRAKS